MGALAQTAGGGGVSRAGPAHPDWVLAHKWANVSVTERLGSWIYGSKTQRKGRYWSYNSGNHWLIGGKAMGGDESPKEKMHGDRGLANANITKLSF